MRNDKRNRKLWAMFREAAELMHLAQQAVPFPVLAEQGGGGSMPQRHDYFWLYQLDLPHQIGSALCNLLRLRAAPDRPAAFHDIAQIHLAAALQLDRSQHIIQQLPSLPGKGLACRFIVLGGP